MNEKITSLEFTFPFAGRMHHDNCGTYATQNVLVFDINARQLQLHSTRAHFNIWRWRSSPFRAFMSMQVQIYSNPVRVPVKARKGKPLHCQMLKCALMESNCNLMCECQSPLASNGFRITSRQIKWLHLESASMVKRLTMHGITEGITLEHMLRKMA